MNNTVKIIVTAVIAIAGTVTTLNSIPEKIEPQVQYEKVDDDTVRITTVQVNTEELDVNEIKRVQQIFIQRKQDVANGLVTALPSSEDYFIEKYQKDLERAAEVGVEPK